MKQADLGLNPTTKRTREFLAQMDREVPWATLVGLVAPHAPAAKTGRPPVPLETMLRIHFMQQWFTLGYPAVEEHMPAVQILGAVDELLRDKGLLLKAGTVVDATLIPAPSSTKNQGGEGDPEMHQAKKGNEWHFGMKAHIGVDAESGPVHTVEGTAKLPDAKDDVDRHVAMRPGKRRALDTTKPADALIDEIERLKASLREGRASVPCRQAPVRPCDGALSRAKEEHRAAGDAVRAVESVDSAASIAGTGWANPSESGEWGLKNPGVQPAVPRMSPRRCVERRNSADSWRSRHCSCRM